LALLGQYLAAKDSFAKQVRSALTMPLITLVCCVCVAGIIFIMIIPRFAQLFASMHQQLPATTRALLAMSNALTGWNSAFIFVIGSLWFMALKYLVRNVYGKYWFDRFILALPGINALVKDAALKCWLDALAMALQTGTSLLPALRLSTQVVTNQVLKYHVTYLEYEVATGTSLSDALLHHEQLFDAHIIALARIGQESGRLGIMLEQAAQACHERVAKRLALITALLQPTLIVLIGVSVAIVVYAIYIPIFNLGHVVA
jgi:type II secretory pathway component PulF